MTDLGKRGGSGTGNYYWLGLGLSFSLVFGLACRQGRKRRFWERDRAEFREKSTN